LGKQVELVVQVLVEWVEWVVEPELMVLVELELDRMV